MTQAWPQRGAVGVNIQLTIRDENDAIKDISTATTKEIILEKPNGSTVTKTASFVTNGGDGKIHYVTLANDLDQASLWKVQAHIVTPLYDLRSTLGHMIVLKNAGD